MSASTVPSRQLDFAVFDADNHMYEKKEALTKFLPESHRGVIDFAEVRGRTKITVKGQISEYIPNPTFERVAAPGAQEEYFKDGNPDGKSRREILGRAIDAPPAFSEPGPRLALMDELGIDRALMFPTLGSLVEERLRSDPEAVHVVAHSLNQWMHEHWSFNYEDRIFAVPLITLPIVDEAVKSLEWVLERGAKVILVSPRPVPGFKGSRSFALPEFDPFWRLVEQSGVVVGMHAGDSGYQRYVNEWEGITDEMAPFGEYSPFAVIHGHDQAIMDSIASAIGHGLCTRFPGLKFTPVENGSIWVPRIIEDLERAHHSNPHIFDEHPVEVFKRNFFMHPFHEEDPVGLVKLLGPDNVIFGSDYPHPEGMSDPITFVDELAGLPADQIAKVMGGNLTRLMNLEPAIV